jgi:hypothetical protein
MAVRCDGAHGSRAIHPAVNPIAWSRFSDSIQHVRTAPCVRITNQLPRNFALTGNDKQRVHTQAHVKSNFEAPRT